MSATTKDLIHGFTQALPLDPNVAPLLLDFGGYVTSLVTNSSELREKLAVYFRDFLAQNSASPDVTITALEGPSPDPGQMGVEFSVKQPDPGKTKIKEEWFDFPDGRAVRKRLTGMLFAFGAGEHLAVGPCVANDNQVVNFINNRFIEWTLDNGALLFHAAGVARGDRGIAMAGFSGMGKSTLALHAMRLDMEFVSNDRLMVRRDPEGLTMYGVAKMPRINPGTVLNNPALTPVIPEHERKEFEALPLNELWDLEHKFDAFIDECYGPGRFRLKSPMTGLVLLNWKRDGSPLDIQEIDLAGRDDLMPAFMKSVGLFYGPGKDAEMDQRATPEAYRELLAGCPVYELSGGVDFEAAAQFVNELL
ncbi:MAG: HprK-related kinase B [Desulfovibrio sp.]|nr:MAG: HprK-related kinase B [Desulfovibrio sp.]